MKKNIAVIYILSILIVNVSINLKAEEMLSWPDCIKITLEKHPDLASAKEKINQAKAAIGIKQSNLLPKIDANARAQRSLTYPYGESSEGSTDNSFSYGISAEQLLFDGGQSGNEVKSAKFSLKSKNMDLLVASAIIRQNLRYSFVRLLSAQESLKITTEILMIRENNLQLVRMRYKAGLEHLGSLLTAEANLAKAEFKVAEARRNLVLYQASLAHDMGLEKNKPLKIKGDLGILCSYSDRPDFETIANSNPELKSLIQQRFAAEYDIKSAKSDYYPKIYGFLDANRSGTEPWPDSAQYSAGIQMSFNLFQGGKNHYQIKQAEAAYKQLFADEKSTHNTILYYLEKSWISLQSNIDTITVQRKFLKAAEERAKIADAQYSIGSIEFDNWTVIQDNLVNAKEEILSAETNAMLSEADWIYAQGGTLNHEQAD